MPTLVTHDGVEIYYKDWGTGRPVIFSHGWPLNADNWESQMFFLAARGFRTIAGGTAARASPGTATTWITMRMTSRC